MEIVFYLFSLALWFYVFFKLGRVEYSGPAIVLLELFSVVGICVYPLIFLLGLIEPGVEGAAFLVSNAQPPGLMTSAHVFAWSAGAAIAVWYGSANAIKWRESRRPGSVVKAKESGHLLNVDFRSDVRFEDKMFSALTSTGLVIYGLLFWLIGWQTLFANAARGRSGEFDGFGAGVDFLFLKTLGQSCLVALIFLPSQIDRKRHGWVSLYFVFVVIYYMASISRNALLLGLIVPVATVVHLWAVRQGVLQIRGILVISALIVLASVVLLFGKGFGHVLSQYFEDGTITSSIDPYQESYNPFVSYLRQTESQWYSIDAGISNFTENGPLAVWDIPKSMFLGWIPSRWMTDLGIADLDYRANPEAGLAGTNTARFGLSGASIPPLACGYASYLFPILGGFLMSYVKFSLYARCARLSGWRRSALALLVFSAFLFIPSVYPLAIVSAIFVIGGLWLFRRYSNKNEIMSGSSAASS